MALTEQQIKDLQDRTKIVQSLLMNLRDTEMSVSNASRLVAQCDNDNQIDLSLHPKAGTPMTLTWPGRGTLTGTNSSFFAELEPKLRALVREYAAAKLAEVTRDRDRMLCEINGLTVEDEEDANDNRNPRKVRLKDEQDRT